MGPCSFIPIGDSHHDELNEKSNPPAMLGRME